jgi:hypothetical protein
MDLYYHIDSTYEIARKLGFGGCAALFLAEGNMDTDLRHWDDEPMHGMTSDPTTGKKSSDPKVAEKEWKDWIESNKDKAKDALKKKDCRAALYHLGLALHSVQDREAHKGMMNPEHAVLELKRKSPDNDSEAKKSAQKKSAELLKEFLDSLGAADRALLKKCGCEEKLTVRRPKLNMDGPVSFKLEGIKYILSHRKPKKVRWPWTNDKKDEKSKPPKKEKKWL